VVGVLYDGFMSTMAFFWRRGPRGQLCGEGGLSDTHTTCSIIVIISVISTVHITSVG